MNYLKVKQIRRDLHLFERLFFIFFNLKFIFQKRRRYCKQKTKKYAKEGVKYSGATANDVGN